MLQWKQTRFSEKAEADNKFSTSDFEYFQKFIHSPVMPFLIATIFPLHQLPFIHIPAMPLLTATMFPLHQLLPELPEKPNFSTQRKNELIHSTLI